MFSKDFEINVVYLGIFIASVFLLIGVLVIMDKFIIGNRRSSLPFHQ